MPGLVLSASHHHRPLSTHSSSFSVVLGGQKADLDAPLPLGSGWTQPPGGIAEGWTEHADEARNMLEFATRAIGLGSGAALGAAWAQASANGNQSCISHHTAAFAEIVESFLLSSPLGAYALISMIQPCWNHLESFSLKTTLRSYDLSSKCFPGPIGAVQSTLPMPFISPRNPVPLGIIFSLRQIRRH